MIQVWYHENCNDGIVAAWICNKFLNAAEFFPLSYNSQLPEVVPGDIIYCVDFCPNSKEVINNIRENGCELIIIDHHISREDFPLTVYDSNKSGSLLTWEFFSEEPFPWFLKHVNACDLGKPLEESEYIHDLIRANRTFSALDQLEKMNQLVACDLGKAITNFKFELINELIEKSFPGRLNGIQATCINTPIFATEIQHRMKCDLLVCFHQFDSMNFKYDLRSNGIVNCAELASVFQGGGHKKAAGFYSFGNVIH